MDVKKKVVKRLKPMNVESEMFRLSPDVWHGG